MKKGPLVRVELQPGRFVKMYEQDAIAQGLLEAKAKPPGENKMLPPAGNKMVEAQGSKGAGEQDDPPDPPADDLTTIDGIGPATARALQARGITTFEDLRKAGDLNFISAQAQKAIDEWKNVDDTD